VDFQGAFGVSDAECSHARSEMIACGRHYTIGCVAYQRGKLAFDVGSRGIVNRKAE
jgi:hypothetical protein